MVGSIDPRGETGRGTHWPVKVAGVFGARVAENHLGQRSKVTASTGRTYGCKRSDQTLKNSCGTGAVHIWRADAQRTRRRLRDRPVGGFAALAEPELQEETDGRIDRSEVRDSPWDPLACKGRWSVWNSRRGKPSWPAVPDRINRPDIWMQAIRSNLEKLLRHGGRPHMGPGVRRDDSRGKRRSPGRRVEKGRAQGALTPLRCP